MATKRHSFRGDISEDVKKDSRTTGKSYLNLPEGIKQYSIKEGLKKISIDILPYIVSDPKHPNRDVERGNALEGDLWYRRPFKIHRNVGTEKDTVICPKSVGKPCPICAYQKERYDAGATVDEVKDLYPSDRNLYVIVPFEQEEYDEIPYVWDMSERLFQDTLKDKIEEDPKNYKRFPYLEDGYTLEVSLKWKTLGKSTFPEAVHIEMDERKPYDDNILDDVADLDTVLNILSFDEIKSKFFETVDEEDGGTLKPVREDDEREDRRERRSESRKEPVEREERTSRRERAPEEKTTRRERAPEPEEEKPVRRERSSREEKPVERRREVSRDKDEADTVDERRSEKKATRREPEKTTSKGGDKCPYGHRFGIDTEKFNDCDDCKLFDDCLDAKEAK